jgi:hypothetical protein
MSRAKPVRKKKLLSRELVASIKRYIYEDVDVPGWGCAVRMRVLNGRERIEYETFLTGTAEDNADDQLAVMTKLLSVVIVGEDRQSIFTEKELEELNAPELVRLTTEALRINKLTAESVKDLEKNS